ncbi:MAG: asparagine synthase (glutamine-hydrolyzing) [Candidatus Omnitrophota bacterium]|nr:asparagine synthase (glutamine-hydrolyzing) [Candidatus Omnitrophota bacterium]
MCGIAAIFSLDGTPVKDARLRAERMKKLLYHRGPDSCGVYVSPDGACALAVTRLAIVEPGNTLSQPLATADGKCVLAFNGEIYNYLEMRQYLQSRGVRLRTKMDTEILLEGLRLEGESFLERLDGMWAFAFYNAADRSLLLSRDVLGERHLFYRVEGNELIFASEVKPLLADSSLTFKLDFESFLTSLQYFAPAPGKTMVRGIERLRPGYNIQLKQNVPPRFYLHRKLHPEKWFGFFDKEPSFQEVTSRFEDLFLSVCKRRFPREVPFMSTLSGGIDSTAICIFLSEYGKVPVRTLFGEGPRKQNYASGEMTEYEASLFTSRKLGTSHSYINFDCSEYVDVLIHLAGNAFDGIYDNGTAMYEMLARHAHKNGAKVLLFAEGPDEFLGYPKDLRAYTADRLYHRNKIFFKIMHFLSSHTSGRRLLEKTGFAQAIIPNGISYKPFRFSPINKSWGRADMLKLVSHSQFNLVRDHYGVAAPQYDDIRHRLDFAQMRALSYAAFSLPDMYNLRIDKGNMNTSVEARLPYQAPEMVEFLVALPSVYRFGKGVTTKYILREVVRKHIGPEIAYRKKRGFALPLWDLPHIYKAMGYDEILRATPVFEEYSFSKGLREFILREENKSFVWPFYALARVHEQLEKKLYLKNIDG